MEKIASELEEYFDRLWPIMRSITGDGVRKTHEILSEIIPLKTMEIPSGTKILDWTVPKEWVCKEAYVIDPNGKRILDIKEHTLHLVNYSAPFKGKIKKSELENHLHSIPDQPNAIPYVTSYYSEDWGFCLSHQQRQELSEGEYEVVIDTDFIEGSLTISEVILKGNSDREILFSTYTCHPSMANNELSGPLVTAFLYKKLAAMSERKYTYRFSFHAETIGAICYLDRLGSHLKKYLDAGYVITCTGDSGPFTYKQSRGINSLADRAAEWTLKRYCNNGLKILPFNPADGSDDRHYCSPGFNLPVGSLMRTMYGKYPEYHTSDDNRNFISFDAMEEAVEAYAKICETLEENARFENLVKYGEPQLGTRGLYPSTGGVGEMSEQVASLLWVLNYSDGKYDLLDIANMSGLDIRQLALAADKCCKAGIARGIDN